jgi:hypothetical protein
MNNRKEGGIWKERMGAIFFIYIDNLRCAPGPVLKSGEIKRKKAWSGDSRSLHEPIIIKQYGKYLTRLHRYAQNATETQKRQS